MRPKLWIIAPCYFDSASFVELLGRARTIVHSELPELDLRAVAVDDSGGQDRHISEAAAELSFLVESTPFNLGHQGALVYALRKIAPSVDDYDYVVTMDSDGEDRPEDIPALLRTIRQNEDLSLVALAQRTKRNESALFKICYSCFKLTFAILTGTVVRNGNFAAYRGWYVRNVLRHPYFDYCYSSSLLALSRRRHHVPLARGTRYYGTSKMTFVTLVMHGFRMLLPFSEQIAIRSFLSASLMICVSLAILTTSVYLCSTGFAYASLGLALAGVLFFVAITNLATAALFFQVVSQTRALSLRSLTLVQPPPQGAQESFSKHPAATSLR